MRISGLAAAISDSLLPVNRYVHNFICTFSSVNTVMLLFVSSNTFCYAMSQLMYIDEYIDDDSK